MFFDLNDHVVGEILAVCDICSVLSFTRLNRYYRGLALTKQLWIRLLRRLQAEDFLDACISLQELEESSTAALIDEVKRIVLGPQSWSPSGGPPFIRRTIRVQVEEDISEPSVWLIAGGRYALLNAWGMEGRTQRLYNVLTGQRIAAFEPEGDPSFLVDVNIPEGGDAAYVITLRYQDWTETLLMKVQRVDLRTSNIRDLWTLELPDSLAIDINTGALALSGDIITLTYDTESTFKCALLVFNWRTNEYSAIRVEAPNISIAFLPGFICTSHTTLSGSDDHLLSLYTLSSFEWYPTATLADSDTDAMPPPPYTSKRFSMRTGGISLTAHRDPLRSECYKIMLYLCPSPIAARELRLSPEPPASDSEHETITHVPSATLFSYRFSLDKYYAASPPSDLQPLSASPAALIYNKDLIISYAGYAYNTTETVDVLYARNVSAPPLSNEEGGRIVLSGMNCATEISSYGSGHAQFDEDTKVVTISYYR
uniref:F-box domain-containing protein n=1 Tax=Mycena chlorophos TaxID=658473 RepID=A0ABQ0LKM9_MYCCL|nr:predicted protein [Mycena chlorophos]